MLCLMQLQAAPLPRFRLAHIPATAEHIKHLRPHPKFSSCANSTHPEELDSATTDPATFISYNTLVSFDLQLVIAFREDLGIPICLLCPGEALYKTNIAAHYGTVHRMLRAQVGPCVSLLEAIIRFCDTLPLADEKIYPVFSHWTTPQPYLPIRPGFLCVYCTHCTTDIHQMHEHLHANHLPPEFPPLVHLGFPPQVEQLVQYGFWLASGFIMVPVQIWHKNGQPWAVDTATAHVHP